MKDYIDLKTFAECEELTIDAIYKRIKRGRYPTNKIMRVSRPVGGFSYMIDIYHLSASLDAEERKIKMSNNYNSNQLDRLVNEIEGRLNDFDTGITDKDETIKSFAELIIKCAETAVNSIPMQAGVILHCRNCNKPIKEFLRIDTDEDETICLPFCDEQCMDAYKEQDPDYFS